MMVKIISCSLIVVGKILFSFRLKFELDSLKQCRKCIKNKESSGFGREAAVKVLK